MAKKRTHGQHRKNGPATAGGGADGSDLLPGLPDDDQPDADEYMEIDLSAIEAGMTEEDRERLRQLLEGEPEEQSGKLVEMAKTADDPELGMLLLGLAVELDPDNVQAGRLLGEALARALPGEVAEAREKIAREEAALGPDVIREHAGRLGEVETAGPYLSARRDLFDLFFDADKTSEALSEAESILALDPSDPLQLGPQLLVLHLRRGEADKAIRILDQRGGQLGQAMHDYGRVFAASLKKDNMSALVALERACQANPHVIRLMLGADVPDWDEDIPALPGSPEEALDVLMDYSVFLDANPAIAEWMIDASEALDLAGQPKKRVSRERGEGGKGKKRQGKARGRK